MPDTRGSENKSPALGLCYRRTQLGCWYISSCSAGLIVLMYSNERSFVRPDQNPQEIRNRKESSARRVL